MASRSWEDDVLIVHAPINRSLVPPTTLYTDNPPSRESSIFMFPFRDLDHSHWEYSTGSWNQTR